MDEVIAHHTRVPAVLLLLGSLYHLTDRRDRIAASREARRVLCAGGRLFAAAISRFASRLDGLVRGYFDEPAFAPILDRDLLEGWSLRSRGRRRHPGASLDLRRGSGHATSMDSRTIELDAEAYEALARQKLPGQSFSEVIKSHFGRRATAADLKQVAARLRISEDTLDAIEAQIRARSESPATAADL
jgi:predicted CopG family antitoxin